MPPTRWRDELELAVQMGLGAPLIAINGYGAPELGRAWGRTRELAQQLGDPPQLWPARSAIYQYYLVRAELQMALGMAQQMADAGERAGGAFPFRRAPLRISRLYVGRLEAARTHLEAMVAGYDREKHRSSASAYGQDTASHSESEPFLVEPAQARRSPARAGRGLRLVHRRL